MRIADRRAYGRLALVRIISAGNPVDPLLPKIGRTKNQQLTLTATNCHQVTDAAISLVSRQAATPGGTQSGLVVGTKLGTVRTLFQGYPGGGRVPRIGRARLIKNLAKTGAHGAVRRPPVLKMVLVCADMVSYRHKNGLLG
jgi:hypothetical protein